VKGRWGVPREFLLELSLMGIKTPVSFPYTTTQTSGGRGGGPIMIAPAVLYRICSPITVVRNMTAAVGYRTYIPLSDVSQCVIGRVVIGHTLRINDVRNVVDRFHQVLSSAKGNALKFVCSSAPPRRGVSEFDYQLQLLMCKVAMVLDSFLQGSIQGIGLADKTRGFCCPFYFGKV